jgi:trk system potassium uptake protein
MNDIENSNGIDSRCRTPFWFNIDPERLILLSFLLVIGVGTALLALPQANTTNLSWLNAFLTATSSTCVTGLSFASIDSFTPFGKLIILALIQIGGLGLMTLSFCLAALFLDKLGVAARSIASEVVGFTSLGKIKRFLFLIIALTSVIEILGAALLFLKFRSVYPLDRAIFHSLFLSISAFCNAGITLSPNNLMDMAQQTEILSVLGILVFAGGLGFSVLFELTEHLFSRFSSEQKHRHLSLHSKIVISISLTLVLAGTLIIWMLEANGMFANMSAWAGLSNSFFYSVCLRSAGFYTAHTALFSPATLLIFMVLMNIGASPGSTGGGIKTTTLALFVASVTSILKRRDEIEIFGRKIAKDQMHKAIAIVALSLFWLTISTFILLLTDRKFTFFELIFESMSAFSTTGLSMGITERISDIGKIVLSISMILGRIGSLTLVFSLRTKGEKKSYKFPEERVLLG